jgi:hypothetical protein
VFVTAIRVGYEAFVEHTYVDVAVLPANMGHDFLLPSKLEVGVIPVLKLLG